MTAPDLLRLSEIAGMVDGKWIGEDANFCSVSTDSRTLVAGALFVALKGPNFDGHSFLDQARARGAAGAVTERPWKGGLPQVVVADSRRALRDLAAIWRRRHPLPLVAITGSNGKTTVKEMLAAILGAKGPVMATEGNLNNEIGAPLTLLRLRSDHAYAVIELGANHPGEIALLSRIARPDVAVINNAGAAHLEGFGSIEGVARAKGEILLGLGDDGVAVINADDVFAEFWRQKAARHRVVRFGTADCCDVRTDPGRISMRWEDGGFRCCFPIQMGTRSAEVELALGGRHNVMNALAASAAAVAVGATLRDVESGLRGMRPVRGRLECRRGLNGAHLVDDTYNANPDSVMAAVDVLSTAPGVRYLVLGDLAELGGHSEALHADIGEQARRRGIDHLYGVGSASAHAVKAFGSSARHFSTQADLVADLSGRIDPGCWVLVKGSRRAAMDRVADALAMAEGG